MKKVFDTEYAAQCFAKEVGGKVEAQNLPDYMGVVTVWIVRW